MFVGFIMSRYRDVIGLSTNI